MNTVYQRHKCYSLPVIKMRELWPNANGSLHYDHAQQFMDTAAQRRAMYRNMDKPHWTENETDRRCASAAYTTFDGGQESHMIAKEKDSEFKELMTRARAIESNITDEKYEKLVRNENHHILILSLDSTRGCVFAIR